MLVRLVLVGALLLDRVHFWAVGEQTSMALCHGLHLHRINVLVRAKYVDIKLGIAVRVHQLLACHVVRAYPLHRAEGIGPSELAALGDLRVLHQLRRDDSCR